MVATRAAPTFLTALALGASTATAADPELTLSRELTLQGPVDVMAERVELSRTEPSVLEGNVEIRTGNRYLGADRVRYDPATGDVQAEGDVRFGDPQLEVSGTLATFDSDLGGGRLSNTEFTLKGTDGRGAAARIERRPNDVLELEGVTYTTCPAEGPGADDWLLSAPFIQIDRGNEVGVARKVRVEFKGVPILYAPYLSFPLSQERKSGFLPPDVGTSRRSGTDIAFPYYWNLRPNIDLQTTPRLLTSRGVQLGNELRYLLPRSRGTVNGEYLPNDEQTNEDRRLASIEHTTRFSDALRLDANVAAVSDGEYFQDLGRSLSAASITHLERRVDVDWRRGAWRVLGRFQNFQTLDDTIARTDRPYERAPQLVALAEWPDAPLGLEARLWSELANFERDDGVTGQRLDLLPEIALPFSHRGLHFTPSVAIEHTRYDLSDTEPGADDAPTRTAPIVNLDTRAVLERTVGRSNRIQTLEPRARYTYIPLRDQDELPVFDTGEPDFNFVQIFRDNRFTGSDRLGDANQLALGITSRLIDGTTGDEYLNATLGQIVYFDEPEVGLPGEPPETDDLSDLLAEVRLRVSDRWNADVGYQWDPERTRADKSAVRFQYRLWRDGVVNLGYRFRRADLEQTDISFALPVGPRFEIVGRWNYSLPETETLERFLGFEYQSCCWAARFVTRRYVSTRNGDIEHSIFLQLELKGLSSIGSPADTLLEHGILGYDR